MDENKVREIVRDEAKEEIRELKRELEGRLEQLNSLLGTDRYVVEVDMEFLKGRKIITDTDTGLTIGTSTSQKLGFFGATPVTQQSGDVVNMDTVSGTGDDSTINNNFTDIENAINQHDTALRNYGLFG